MLSDRYTTWGTFLIVVGIAFLVDKFLRLRNYIFPKSKMDNLNAENFFFNLKNQKKFFFLMLNWIIGKRNVDLFFVAYCLIGFKEV